MSQNGNAIETAPVESSEADADVVSIEELKAMFGARGGLRVTVACNVAPANLGSLVTLIPTTTTRP